METMFKNQNPFLSLETVKGLDFKQVFKKNKSFVGIVSEMTNQNSFLFKEQVNSNFNDIEKDKLYSEFLGVTNLFVSDLKQ